MALMISLIDLGFCRASFFGLQGVMIYVKKHAAFPAPCKPADSRR